MAPRRHAPGNFPGMETEKLIEEVTGQVRAALEDAQEKADGIVADAEVEAERIVADAKAEAGSVTDAAQADAQKTRNRAEGEAQQRLSQVREALLGVEGVIGQSPAAEVPSAPVEVPEPAPPLEDPVEPAPAEPEIDLPGPAEPETEPDEDVAPGGSNGFTGQRSHDETAARIVAMKMALDGASRDEISSHLDANYDIEASDQLLDDVIARANR